MGRSAQEIGALCGLDVPEWARIIVVPVGSGEAELLGKEKMCPVLAAYGYGEFDEAIAIAAANLGMDGKGHSVAIHSDDTAHIEYAAERLPVSRFVINQSCASSAGGSFYNGLAPTNTLGCGSWGGNSISENFTWKHLVNISRIAYFMPENKAPGDEELWRVD